jgi:signal transduction histidine kinase/DNA-binding response OmpR family regulator/streptogramin lyase
MKYNRRGSFGYVTGWLLALLLPTLAPAQLRPRLVREWPDKPTRNVAVNQFRAGKNDTLWMTTDNGLARYQQGQFRLVQHWPEAGSDNVFWLAVTPQNQPWAYSIAQKTLLYADPVSGKTHALPDSARLVREVIRPYGCQTLYADSSGTLWIGTDKKGVVWYNPQSGRIDYAKPETDLITGIQPDATGRIWVLLRTGGLRSYDPHTRRWATYPTNPNDPNGLPTEPLYRLFVRRNGRIILGLNNALAEFDPVSGHVRRWQLHPHLGNPRLLASFFGEDARQHLYFATGSTIYRMAPTGEMRQLLLTHPTAPIAAMHLDAADRLWVSSTTDGIRQYDTRTVEDVPTPVLIDAAINGKPLETNTEAYQFTWPPTGVPTLTLPEGENLTLNLAPGATITPFDSYVYRYRLAGLETDWTAFTNNQATLNYKLAAGRYTLELDVLNRPAARRQTIQLVIRAIWWKTPWFRVVVALAVVGGLGSGGWVLVRRRQLNRQLAKQAMEAEQLRQLNAFKTTLYANVTHEFKTPLTLILNANERRNRPGATERTRQQATDVIEQNAQQLLRLIDELMTVARSEAGELHREDTVGQPLRVVAQCVEAIRPAAESKQLALTYTQTGDPTVECIFDQSKLDKIINNLLSNALKFTPSGGSVSATCLLSDDYWLEIAVSDTGIGIAPSDQKRVFERFFQANTSATRPFEGTGLGLAFVQELVHLLGGSIALDSTLGQGSTFTVRLPLRPAAAPLPAPPPPATADRQLVLLVEDNAMLRQYLVEELTNTYALLEAADGQQGLALALEHVPDLIVSDVMMPGLDGLSLLETLKADHRTSHVPVLLLTARSSLDSRLQGLATGADDYLTKPFSFAELTYRIRNCLQRRQQWQRFFSDQIGAGTLLQSPAETAPPIDVPAQEQAFVGQLKRLILTHIEDDLTPDWLAQQVRLSRTQLHRKLTALTGLSVTHFVNQVRLEKAHELLETSKLNVSEVASRTGYNSPAYFTKLFTARFGKPPAKIKE